LQAIAPVACKKEAENEAFIPFLKNLPSEQVDAAEQNLNEAITPYIDCRHCGNCCKSLLINVTDAEAAAVAEHLKVPRSQFNESYIEEGISSTLLINAIPCPFLKNLSCSIYEHGFQGCKEFPALHIPEFNKRTLTTFMHYSRCPIIFNVVEHLKIVLKFVNES
jgi:Fe-S-cluster containining protein